MSGFGSNQEMLQNDAQQASQILTEYLSGETQDQTKQQKLTVIALALLGAVIIVRILDR